MNGFRELTKEDHLELIPWEEIAVGSLFTTKVSSAKGGYFTWMKVGEIDFYWIRGGDEKRNSDECLRGSEFYTLAGVITPPNYKELDIEWI